MQVVSPSSKSGGSEAHNDARSRHISMTYAFCAACGCFFLWAIGGCKDQKPQESSHERRELLYMLHEERRLMRLEEALLEEKTPMLRAEVRGKAAGEAFMLEHPTFEASSENRCTVCFDRPIDVILDPCGHKAACGLCAQSLKPQRCP